MWSGEVLQVNENRNHWPLLLNAPPLPLMVESRRLRIGERADDGALGLVGLVLADALHRLEIADLLETRVGIELLEHALDPGIVRGRRDGQSTASTRTTRFNVAVSLVSGAIAPRDVCPMTSESASERSATK